MAVQFILGRAGTGKTRHCFSAIDQWVHGHGLQASVFLLTPRQATQVAERQLIASVPGRSLLGVRVISPDTLVREIAPQLAESLELLDGRGRRLLIALAIQQHAQELIYFRGAQHQPHLAARIDSALAEIEQSGASFGELRAGLGKISDQAASKLHDLTLIQSAYAKSLGERLDRHRLESRVIDAIRASRLVANSLVIVDGFADFSPMQRRMMLALAATARRMEIALLADPNDLQNDSSLFARTNRTYERLSREFAAGGIAIEPPVTLAAAHRFGAPELRQLEAAFDSGATSASELSAPAAIRVIEAASDLEEVRHAGQQIRLWLVQGARLRHIGVFCRNLEPYAQWIRPIFAEYDIPCFIDQQRSLCEHPLLRYLRAALRIVADRWRRDSVMDLLKCGLSPLEPQEADRLENFALRHGVDRGQWLADWQSLTPPPDEDESERPDDRRAREEAALCARYRDRLVTLLEPLGDLWNREQTTASAFVAALRELLDAPAAQQQIECWSALSTDAAQEHQQCRAALDELFAAAEQMLADSPLPPRQLADMLLAAMEEMSVKLAPLTLDQVLVGQIDRSRSPEFQRVIVLGLNEGTFPAKAAEDSIFSDAERKTLDAAGVELHPGSSDRAIAEQLIGYIALTRASSELVLSRPRTDESGRKLAASGFLARLQLIFPTLTPTPAQLIASPRVAQGRSRALLYGNEPRLTPDVAAALLGEELICSATRLETFAQCPFQHFLKHSLRLRERDVAEISSLDLGNAFHNVLQELGRRMIAENLDWSSEQLETHLDQLIDDVSRDLRNQVLLSSERNKYLLSVIRRMLLKLCNDQKLLSASGYKVAHTELTFGESDAESLAPLVITTPRGRTVKLRGRIDRVDRRCEGEAQHYLVFDYKTSSRRLSLCELEKGLSLQLMIYWLVMQENGREVDAAFYQQLMRPMKTVKAFEEMNLDKVACKPRGLLRFEARERLDPGLNGGSSLYGLHVKKDGQPGNESSNDTVLESDLHELQGFVRQRIGELADAIFDGAIGISPYQLGNRSPCPFCDFRAVCRFDTSYNDFNQIQPAKRTEVLERINPSRAAIAAAATTTSKKKGKRHATVD